MSEKVKKNKSIRAWVHQHINDSYVNQAQKGGYRSRAAYKLLELDAQDKLFAQVKCVVDLGCAPGSWSQVALQKISANGLVVGVDLLAIEPLAKLKFIQGDFSDDLVLVKLVETLNGHLVDLLISDMAPNLSGIKDVDQARGAYLVELVLDFAKDYLKPEGNCLIKLFHGSEFNQLLLKARELFSQVVIRKPDASRSKSSEVYLLCKHKRQI